MNFTRDNYDVLNADFESDTIQSYAIELPDEDETVFSFSGFVTELPISIPIGDKITCDVTIQISGKVNQSTAS
jgi:hypothetical protein